MRAITVVPLRAGTVRVEERPAPRPGPTELLVQGVGMGVCGTDLEIVNGQYGWAPPNQERLVIGHESLGRVVEAPAGSKFAQGDLVVGIVRRPDPVPCPHCAIGEWDMCSNGQYTERGIKSRDGYGAERYTLEESFAIPLDPSLGQVGVLLEPASVVAKAWEQTDRIGKRARWEPRRTLVIGAGPVGLLAALLGVQRGLEVHVFDRATTGPKPKLVADLGAHYHVGALHEAGPQPDIVIECTGAPSLVVQALACIDPGGIICLTGVPSKGRLISVDAGLIDRRIVLGNQVIFGSVNANRRHYEAAADALRRADKSWLDRLVTRRVGLANLQHAFERRDDDVKVVIDLAT